MTAPAPVTREMKRAWVEAVLERAIEIFPQDDRLDVLNIRILEAILEDYAE